MAAATALPVRPNGARRNAPRSPRIAAGMTNGEIAGELAIAPKTASAHVEHILAKLGVSRRAEIATWVANIALPTTAPAKADPAVLSHR
ncbi:MAG: helix-turn-helix transcriptional regulator [Candidatus Limnocylindrales bacterium]